MEDKTLKVLQCCEIGRNVIIYFKLAIRQSALQGLPIWVDCEAGCWNVGHSVDSAGVNHLVRADSEASIA